MDSAAQIDPESSAPRIRCLLVADLVDSTGLIDRLGDQAAADLMRHLDGVVRHLIQQYRGREIDKTDGYLVLFERAIEAVGFALAYQAALDDLGRERNLPLRARVGIHVGEALTWHNRDEDIAEGAKPIEVEGLAKAVAARLMYLALPGQVLLSETAHAMALRARNELPAPGSLRWLQHGRYRLQGLAAPMGVFEVGRLGVGPLKVPPSKQKVRRLVPWWRSRLALTVLLLAITVPVVYVGLRPRPAIAFTERDWIVVGDVRNLTGDSRFDLGLDTAVRIGLEQSRYVNLVSPLRTRDALKWMQRTAETVVDRETGSLIAQRIGARAVLLPTLAQLNGRVRFSAELVDPYSGVTVYADSSEVGNPDHMLPAVDAVLRKVRGNLGESLASIEKSTLPLDMVTTPSNEALRAYSLSLKAKREQRFLDSRKLLDQAIELDPEFGMAFLARASLSMIEDDYAAVDADLERAAQLSNRLNHRERLMLEATRSMAKPTNEMISAWSVYADMYPEDDRAAYNLSLFAVEFGNDCSHSLHRLGSVVGEALGMRGFRLYEMARCRLMRGDLDLAATIFAEANASGLIGNGTEFAMLHAARGDYDTAMAVLDKENNSRPRSEREQAELARVAVRYLQGGRASLNEALHHLEALKPEFSPVAQRLVELVRLSASVGENAAGAAEPLSNVIASLLDAGAGARPVEEMAYAAQAVAAAWLLARHGHPLDEALSARLDATSARIGHAPIEHLLRLIEAERLVQSGKADQALQLVDSMNDAVVPFVWRSTRMRAHLALEQHDAAVEDCSWMQRQLGRATTERIADGALILSNLFERESCRRKLATAL